MIRSVLVIGLAIAFFASGTNRPVLANLIGTYWLVGALLTLAWARTNRGARGSRVAVAAGVVGVAAAAILLARSLIQDVISLDTALVILGVAAVLTGTLRLAGAFRSEQVSDPPRPVLRIVLGVSEIAIGVVFIAVDELTPTVATVAGLWALVAGTVMLLDALAMRKAMRPGAGAP